MVVVTNTGLSPRSSAVSVAQYFVQGTDVRAGGPDARLTAGGGQCRGTTN
jgi:hypothetical protein